MLADASALAAMLRENSPNGERLAARFETAAIRLTLPTAVLDASAMLAVETGLDAARVHAVVSRFLDAAGIKVAAVPPALLSPAAAILAQHGNGGNGLSPSQCLCVAAGAYYRLPLLSNDPRVVEAAGHG